MDILTLSKSEAENYDPVYDREACISITSPDTDEAVLSKEFVDVCRLEFHDLDTHFFKRLREVDREEWAMDAKPMSHAQANVILDFYRGVVGQVDRLVVHCEAGVSRSVGTAAALALIGNHETQRDVSRGNTYVKNLILEEAGESFREKIRGRSSDG